MRRTWRIQRFLGYDYVRQGADAIEMPLNRAITEDTADLQRSGGRSNRSQRSSICSATSARKISKSSLSTSICGVGLPTDEVRDPATDPVEIRRRVLELGHAARELG